MDQAAYDALSPRERDCLRLIGRGYRGSEVAAELKISKSTVATHLAHARTKLDGMSTRTAGRAIVVFEGHPFHPSPSSPIPEVSASLHLTATETAAAGPMVLREPTGQPGWPPPTDRDLTAYSKGRAVDLSSLQRVGWIIAIATGLAILGVAAFPLAESAHRTVASVLPAHH